MIRNSTIDEADRLLEMVPDFEHGGGKVTSTGGEPLKGMTVEQVTPNIVIWHFPEGSFAKAANWIMAYFMDSEQAAADLRAGKIQPPMFVPGSMSMRFGGYSMITHLWKKPKKFMNEPPEEYAKRQAASHVVGALEAYLTKGRLFIDNLSVRPGWQKNTIGKKLMQAVTSRFPEYELTHSLPTDQGEKFLKKTGYRRPMHRDLVGPQGEVGEVPESQDQINSILLTLLESDEDDAWIGVDFDGTLATHTEWKGPEHCGEPIPKMVARIHRWVREGKKVKIFTARADDEKSVNAIKDWLKENGLPDLEVTNLKDKHLTKLWDDRAVAVEKNTGEVKECDNPECDRACDVCGKRYSGTLICPTCGTPSVSSSLREAIDNPPFTSPILDALLDEANEFEDWAEWEPSPHVVNWFANMLRSLRPDGIWVVPATGQVYQFDKNLRTATLVRGTPDDPEGWHQKTKKVLQVLGYTVHDEPPEPPGGPEQAFAESLGIEHYEAIVTALLGAGAVTELYQLWRYPAARQRLIVNWELLKNDAKRLWRFLKSGGVDESLLLESPEIKTLKDHQVKLTDEERAQVMKAGAVWHHGPNGEESPAVKKSVVNGKTWYWCATHRAGQVKPTLKGAIKAFEFVKTTS